MVEDAILKPLIKIKIAVCVWKWEKYSNIIIKTKILLPL